MLLSVVILSFNRRDALLRTLGEVDGWREAMDAEVIVVDNASKDGSVAAVKEKFAWAKVISLAENKGVAGFNTGVAMAEGELVLILDDDSWPDRAGLEAAVACVKERATIGGVALVPKHPKTKVSEWAFANQRTARCAIMGCGNLVRRDAWKKVEGYEEAFFLYRNDTDLAMKLLGAGFDVVMDPAWIVWHDSPAAAMKSERWLEIATRNWIWVCRRHGTGWQKFACAVVAIAVAVRHAGPDLTRLKRVFAGVRDGVDLAAPAVPKGVIVDGSGLREYVRMRRG
jgi:GT2 family glycosyltransferase